MIKEKAGGEYDAVDDYQDNADYLPEDKGPNTTEVSYLYPMISCHDIYSYNFFLEMSLKNINVSSRLSIVSRQISTMILGLWWFIPASCYISKLFKFCAYIIVSSYLYFLHNCFKLLWEFYNCFQVQSLK